MEMGKLAAAGYVDFCAPGAAWFIATIVFGTTPAARLSAWERPFESMAWGHIAGEVA